MKKKKLVTISVILILFFILSTILLFISKTDTIVILFGIQTARMLRTSITIIAIIGVSILLITFLLTLFKKEKEHTVNTIDKCLLESIHQELSELKTLGSKKWSIRQSDITKIINETNCVIEYYKQMQKEIDIANNYDISDTCEILEKVLEAILQYLRHAVRLLNVMSKSDHNMVSEELDKTKLCISNLKEKAQNFIISILDYMKDDEIEENALDNIASFKELILDEVDLVDKYISI